MTIIRCILYGLLISFCFLSGVDARTVETATPHEGMTSKALKARDRAFMNQYVIVKPVYSGLIRQPDFKKRNRQYAAHSTRLRLGLKNGPNFAGRYAIVEIGCGTGCRSVYIINAQTGDISDFPLGGENNMYLNLSFALESRALVAYWENPENDHCIRTELLWHNRTFRKIDEAIIGPRALCNS